MRILDKLFYNTIVTYFDKLYNHIFRRNKFNFSKLRKLYVSDYISLYHDSIIYLSLYYFKKILKNTFKYKG